MSGVERLAVDWPDGREVVLAELVDWQWPAQATSEWFTLFVAADARRASDQQIRSLATAILPQRCACMAAWGPDCGRVHLCFDEAYVTWAAHRIVRRWGRWRTTWSDDIPFLLTTDHADESLPAALWDAVYNAWPSGDGYFEDRRPDLVALVETPFLEQVRELLLDSERLNREADSDE